MKRLSIIVGLLAVLLLPLASFSCAANVNIKATLRQEFTLPVGKTADFASEGFSMKFVEVSTDSRCANGVECVRAGEAKCLIQITIMGSPADMTLTQTGG
ncbi:MAG: hypothetical protein ACYDG5_00280, partial [Dehalococcoidales bacterium]